MPKAEMQGQLDQEVKVLQRAQDTHETSSLTTRKEQKLQVQRRESSFPDSIFISYRVLTKSIHHF